MLGRTSQFAKGLMAETHLQTSAELQNQSAAIQKE